MTRIIRGLETALSMAKLSVPAIMVATISMVMIPTAFHYSLSWGFTMGVISFMLVLLAHALIRYPELMIQGRF